MNGVFWLVLAACAIDRLIGDPRSWLHPVQLMGWMIHALRIVAEAWSGNRPLRLRCAGVGITLLVVSGSGLTGWALERLAMNFPVPGLILLVIALASSLAGQSLERAVREVLQALPDLPQARVRLSWIVGRNVTDLSQSEILRAAAETASENAVDGLFAPLFWMLVGAWLWQRWPALPGPLTLAWAFKASSTLDSMLGYRAGRLRWLGTAGARLDDVLTWLPCRLTALTLPLVSGHWQQYCHQIKAACREGGLDPSPNAGVSMAAFAYAAGVRLGGTNRYGNELRSKPIFAPNKQPVTECGVNRILKLIPRLEVVWLLAFMPLILNS